MATKSIDVELLAKMFLAGAQNIEAKKEYINELNVFPVPDGDTGTNMSMTIMAAAKEVTALEGMDMASLAKAISSRSLRGARGNSGVILSQLLRGFTKSIKTESEIDVPALARAAVRAKETAYKAVMKPKEGTILTVAKGVAEKAQTLAEETDDLEEFLPKLIEEAETVLAKTPDMLPVLKEAGVVDSGGQGLLEVLRGAYDAFLGKEIDYSALAPTPQAVNATKVETEGTVDIKFGYCTEFIILLDKEFTEKDEIGVDYIIEGGQTMNPSTEDMLTAIDHVNADYIYILPNNKNIVMAANQARDLTEDKDIIVIPTKTVPQGITAVLNYNAEEDVDTNEETMLEAIKCVKTGQVTYAVRDTHIDDKEIHEGDIMGIGDAGILAVGKSVDGTTKDMLAQLVNDDSELISLYYGEEVSEEEAEKLTAEIEELYPDMDVDAHMGGQPIYYYVLAVE